MSDDCTCWVDPKYWFNHYGAIEPGSQMEYDPMCPEHGEWGKPLVWFHSDNYIDYCGCGEREWQVDLPKGWRYADGMAIKNVKAIFDTHLDAMNYAAQLHPGHPDVKRNDYYWDRKDRDTEDQ